MGSLLIFLALVAAVAAAPFFLSFLVVLATEDERKERSNSISPILFSLYRLTVAIVCYLLSGYGIWLSCIYVLYAAQRMLAAGVLSVDLTALVWIYAWVCHIAMSLAWTVNRKLSKAWPISGGVAVAVGLLFVPAQVSFGVRPPSLYTAWTIFLTEIFLVLPCLLLAIHLIRFHLGDSEKQAPLQSA